jgi:signal transduction histidine kinase
MSENRALELLRRSPLLAGLPEDDLQALYRTAEPIALACGEWLMREGAIGDTLYLVLEGEIEVSKRSGEQDVVLAVRTPGDLIGELALLDRTPRSASCRALQDSRLLVIKRQDFQQVLSASPAATLALLRTFNLRVQSTEALLRQREKMATLGTLAAGLAHELNNPAAAVLRGAGLLRETLAEWQALEAALGALPLDAAQADALRALRVELSRRVSAPVQLDPLARVDQESELQDWLEALGVDEAAQAAPALIEFGLERGALQSLTGAFAPEHVPPVVRWAAASCTLYGLLNDVHAGARRLAETVKAVKTYTYLDQAPVQLVDLHEGLENTLIILRHKLKAGITVTREYAPDLPRIEAYASELNQVWTNLIDNAIDAMSGQGRLTLRTSGQGDTVAVEVADDGPGIPAEIVDQIFDPFFTTKAPGSGTGLGLHIAYNIVQRHMGRIQVASAPGATSFKVTLPVLLKRG